MKILNFFMIFSILFIIPLTTAVEIEMKVNHSEGETLFAKISGNFYEPISKEDIKFNKDYIRTSIIPFVADIDDEFYIYAQLLGKSSGNYSIIIENAKYVKGNDIVEEDLIKNFTIKEGTADFLVNPGFVVTEEDFFIEARNLLDKRITIGWRVSSEFSESVETSQGFFEALFGSSDSDSELEGDTLELKAGETQKINFKVAEFGKFNVIEFNKGNLTYEIPVSIFSKKNQGEVVEETNVSNETNVTISVVVDGVDGENEDVETIGETCSDLGGNICGDNQKCEGSINQTADGTCCVGTCKDVEESSSSGAIIGWIIIIAIVLVVVWFYLKRYKGAKGISDLTRILGRKKKTTIHN